MHRDVRLFALARDRAGAPSVAVDLPEGATVADLKSALAESIPSLAPLLAAARIALDAEYADDDRTIPEGAELAVIPPVSGGACSHEPCPRPRR